MIIKEKIQKIMARQTIHKTATISEMANLTGRIIVGENSNIGPRVRLQASPRIEIGRWVHITQDALIVGDIDIRSFSLFANNLLIITLNHNYKHPSINSRFHRQLLDIQTQFLRGGKTRIGEDVWVGYGVIILGGITIGRGAVIGAGSVVSRDIEPYSIAAGNPAKHIKYRFPEDVIDMLEKSKWWMWSNSKIIENKEFFRYELY